MMSAQLVSILVMFISGIAVGAVIDCTRTVLNEIPSKIMGRFTYIVEWIIWIFLGICTFYFLFLVKGGQWRVVDPLAQIAGIFAYEFIFQKIARFLGRVVINVLIRPILFIGHLIILIIRNVVYVILKSIALLVRPIYKLYKKYLPKSFQKKK
ncbi:spore cortex biosynthesis protein YabQ [Solibacillus sp. FSL K6-1523]|uniref:spore cortex biosynthesis protein YabQ n=1 Tax=Solibacillus sp. FSL K6-1523 TaxID=2921471 RepID=UPI0030FA6826